MKKLYLLLFSIVLFFNYQIIDAQTINQKLNDYNIVWTSQSKNASESMPCGGGDVGLNVWVENDEIFAYIAKSDAFDENNGLDKIGRIRLKINPNPFDGAEFKQELILKDGFVKISAKKASENTEISVWVDVFSSTIHFDVQSSIPRTTEAAFESWRFKDFKLRPGENFENSYKWCPFDTVFSYKDNIESINNEILVYHRNRSYTVFDANVKLQGLDNVKNQLYNPIKHNTFGGKLCGENMLFVGNNTGKYRDSEFKTWNLKSKSPVKRQSILMYLLTKQTDKIEEWKNILDQNIANVKKNEKEIRQKNIEWWNKFWDRSFIGINTDKKDENSPQWQVGRNYQLFRYMLGCNAFGSSPTKFNGGMFTYDSYYTDTTKHFTPDYRNWCGGTMTAQNQRLVYFPMIKSGDFEMMKPQFDFYLKALRNAEIRTEQAWGHKGASFTEQIENYGLINAAEYGWNRPASYDKGMEYNAWLEYLWDTSLEFCFMILENQRYTGKDISEYIPLIESCLTFYYEHYQYLAKQRGAEIFDGNKKLVLYPTSGCETFKMAYNSTSTIAALKCVLEHLLVLPENYLTVEKRKYWKEILSRIPKISFTQHEGHTCIAPAQAYSRVQNEESPQLYPVYPWDMYSYGKSGLDTALNTWNFDPFVKKFRSHVGWKQDNIWAARLGLVGEASDLCIKKLKNSGRRFPAFWGPGFDWTPDHNWGGSGMIGLQEMLMQTTDNRIFLFPAWKKEWNVEFKLHAPQNTTVECVLKNGKIEFLKVTPESRRKDVVLKEF